MNSGERARLAWRGRELTWWLLAVAVLLAVLAAVAKALEWPAWAQATLAGLAVAAGLVVPWLRARYKQEDELAALLEKAAAFSNKGRLRRVRDVTLSDLGVHAAQVQVRYVQRERQPEVAEAIGPGRAVLLVGHSMVGKTRLAAEIIQSKYGDRPLLVVDSGKPLQALVAGRWDPTGVVVWLENLERFLGADGLTRGVLHKLTSGGAIVVGTIRVHAMDTYRPSDKLRPPEWEVLEAFTQIDLKRGHSDAELERIRAEVHDPGVLAAVQHYGLAEYLGAGPLAVDKFESGETTQPVGYALVRAAVDCRRTGLTHPIPKPVLASPAVVAMYLADRPEVPRTEQALDKGVEWATEKINETVALLGPHFTDSTESAFEAFDYLVDHLTLAGPAIPDPLWQLSLHEAQPTEWMDLGYAAYQSNNLPVAELAFRKAADAGDSDAMSNLGALLAERDPAEAESWWRKAADAGNSNAMFNLGVLLEERDPAEAESWYRRAADAGDSDAMFNLGVLLEERDPAEAESWYRRAADAGDSNAMSNLGVLLAERDPAEAESWYRRAADAGHSDAMSNLGVLLAERDPAEAESWYRRAADAGHSDAMNNLGALLAERDPAEAESWYRRAADAGHSDAMNNLGALLAERDPAEAESWYRRAADAGHSNAMFNLGALLAERDPAEAESWYRRAADAGDSDAMNNLGALLAERDPAEAESWYRRAADAGHSTAMSNLGVLLAERDPAEAESWWRKAADAGHSTAMNNLGALLAERDPAEAESWYRRAADAGDSNAMNNLGALLEERDPAEAESWYRRAADAGHSTAMSNLGVLLAERDPAEAESWWRKAADAGHSTAMNNLGVLLEERDPAEAESWYRRAADAES